MQEDTPDSNRRQLRESSVESWERWTENMDEVDAEVECRWCDLKVDW